MAVSSSFKQQCPSCEAMISIKEGMVGKKVECTKCKDKFIAERPEDDEADVQASAKKDAKLGGKKTTKSAETAVAGKRPKLEVEEEDDEDDEPPSKSGKNKAGTNGKANGKPSRKPSKQADDEDADDDDDDTDGKKKKKSKTGAGSNKLVIGLGLAVVGVVILVVAAIFVMPAIFVMKSGGPPPKVNPGGNQEEKKDEGDKKAPDRKNENFKPETTTPASLNDAELARLSNLLPGDTEHVFRIFNKELFPANSPLRQAVFETPGTLEDQALRPKLGFSLLAIDDIIVAERYTSPGWRYTVLHFNESIKEDELKSALKLEAIKIEGQTCYKSAKAHPWFDQLARFSFGIPNYLRFFDGRARDKPSFIRVHNAQTLIIGDKAPVEAFILAKGQFPVLSVRQAPPANPNPGGMMGGDPNPPTPTPKPGPGGKGGGRPRPKGGTNLYPAPGMPLPSDSHGPLHAQGSDRARTPSPLPRPEVVRFAQVKPPSPAQEANPKVDQNPKVDPNPNDPNPKDPNPKVDPNPNGGGRDDTYMTIKPSLKAILDRMEQRGDPKEKVLFSSVTDMDASLVVIDDASYKDRVVRRPREFWDVTLLLYEPKGRIRHLGTSLVQKDALRRYQLRNEIVCGQDIFAQEFQAEMIDRTSLQVAKFIKQLTRHEVRVPSSEKTEPPPAGEQKPEDKKPQEATMSQIAVNWQEKSPSVEFVLDLLLDNPALTNVQGISTLTASVMRVEMEAAASLSLRHALGAAGKLLGAKGLTERGVAPGRFPPGAFDRDSKNPPAIDKEPRNRISWMAGLLPHMGHENLFKRIQFNQSWRDSGNWMAGNTIVPQFLDPSYPDYTRQLGIGDLPLDFAATHYVGIAGVGLDAASYKPGDPATDHKRGVLSYDGSASLDEVQKGRGLSNTILMIQVPHDGITGVSPWIAGGGATLRGVPETNSIDDFVLSTDRNNNPIVHSKDGGKTKQRGTCVLMTDGSVRFIDQSIADETFKAMCTINGPAPKDFDLKNNPNVLLVPPPQGAKSKQEPKKLPAKTEPDKTR
jgi:Protein of unknown function (DUF1559)